VRPRRSGRRYDPLVYVFEILVSLPALATIGYLLYLDRNHFTGHVIVELAAWVVVVAVVELTRVNVWRGIHISVGFPLLMAVAFMYLPSAAGIVALLAASDPRELKREVDPLRAVFNRCQVALSVLAASSVFHAIASLEQSVAIRQFAAAALAAAVDYVVNVSLVAVAAGLIYRVAPTTALRQLRIGQVPDFLVSYLGLAVFGLILARVFIIPEVGFWSVPIFVVPLLLARQMFFRSKALEEAHKELQDREKVLRALSNRMAEERQDERAQIAGYLHDDLAQLLFKLSLQVDIAERHLSAGKVEETERTLEEIKETKAKTSDRIRALIRDLHRSPLGRAGLKEALHGFIAETAQNADVNFRTDIDEVPLPPPIALLLYHIAREGVMNALKHAHASNVWLSVKQRGDGVELVLRDDGVGFDTEMPGPEGHYGLTMMRERALVGGGTFAVESVPGEGATITVRFPMSLLQQEEAPPEGAPPPEEETPREEAPQGGSPWIPSGGYPGSVPTPAEEHSPESASA
jgi:signal transduction histidine kinase